MFKSMLFASLACSALGLGLLMAEDKVVDKAPTTQKVIFNKKCPVEKGDVDPKVETVEYDGKTIGFCCEDCPAKFKKDPEKYAKDLK